MNVTRFEGMTSIRRGLPALVAVALVAVAVPAHAADPAAKELRKASRGVEKTVRQLGAVQVSELKTALKALLADVASEAATPTDALGDAVLAAAEAGAAVSTAAFDGVATVRDDAVAVALGGGEGAVLLGEDFQAGGGGVWDDFIVRLHRVMDRVDVRLEKELWKFAGKLEKTAGKLDIETNVHLQVRPHDTRIDAIQCPASLAANPGAEAGLDIPIRQVHIEARIVEVNLSFSSHLGIRGFGALSVDFEYITNDGSTLVEGVPMLPSGVALSTRMIGDPSIGPYRVDVLDPDTGERSDSVGGRPPSNTRATGVGGIVKQARKSMRQDFKFYGQVTGQVRADYRKMDKEVCKDHAMGRIDTESALLRLFGNQRNALGGANLWMGVVTDNPLSSARSELITAGVPDEGIPDDLSADAGEAFTMHLGKVHRRYGQRVQAFTRIGERSIDQILKKAAKDGENAAVNSRFGRNIFTQGPTITTLDDPVLQLGFTPHISGVGIISLEVSPQVAESTAVVLARTPVDDVFEVSHVNIADGQTVVIGGLKSSGDETTETKIPLLGDLPLLGRLFRVSQEMQGRTDLIVIVTPHILSQE